MKDFAESPSNDNDSPLSTLPATEPRRLAKWLIRILFSVVWLAIYFELLKPLDTWFLLSTLLIIALRLYKRFQVRMKLPELRLSFERPEKITLVHALLAMILLLLLASQSKLAELKIAVDGVGDSVTDLQNHTSDDADDIKSKLDDLEGVEASK